MTFSAHNGTVTWHTDCGPVRLSDWQCGQLLDLLMVAEGAVAPLYNQLHAAAKEAQGELWIDRPSPFRPVLVVSDSAPSSHTRRMLEASLREMGQ